MSLSVIQNLIQDEPEDSKDNAKSPSFSHPQLQLPSAQALKLQVAQRKSSNSPPPQRSKRFFSTEDFTKNAVPASSAGPPPKFTSLRGRKSGSKHSQKDVAPQADAEREEKESFANREEKNASSAGESENGTSSKIEPLQRMEGMGSIKQKFRNSLRGRRNKGNGSITSNASGSNPIVKDADNFMKLIQVSGGADLVVQTLKSRITQLEREKRHLQDSSEKLQTKLDDLYKRLTDSEEKAEKALKAMNAENGELAQLKRKFEEVSFKRDKERQELLDTIDAMDVELKRQVDEITHMDSIIQSREQELATSLAEVITLRKLVSDKDGYPMSGFNSGFNSGLNSKITSRMGTISRNPSTMRMRSASITLGDSKDNAIFSALKTVPVAPNAPVAPPLPFNVEKSDTIPEAFTPLPPEAPIPPPLSASLGANGKNGLSGILGGMFTKKKKPMRVLHWDKLIPQEVRNTIWSQLSEKYSFEMPEDQLDDLFQEKKTTRHKNVVSHRRRAESQKIRICQNEKVVLSINLLLGKLKLRPDDVADAILAMDEQLLHASHLKTILTFLPDKDLSEKFQSYNSAVEMLSSVDKLFYRLCQISGLELRLRLWIFKLNFPDDFQSKMEKICHLEKAILFLQNNPYLPVILSAILQIGNYLNQSHTKGGAGGFRLKETLSKIKMVKTFRSDDEFPDPLRPKNLMEYIIFFLEQTYPECLDFPSRIESIKIAAKTEQANFISGVRSMKEEMVRILEYLEIPSSHPRLDKSQYTLRCFYTAMSDQIDDMYERAERLIDDVAQMSAYYGEKTPPKCWEEFFDVFVEFAANFEASLADLKVRREKAASDQRFRDYKMRLLAKVDKEEPNEEEIKEFEEMDPRDQFFLNIKRKSIRARIHSSVLP